MATLKHLVILSVLVSCVVCQFEFECVPAEDCKKTDTTTNLIYPEVVPHPDEWQKFYICGKDTEKTPSEQSYTCGDGFAFDGETNPASCVEGSYDSPKCSKRVPSTCKTSCGERDDLNVDSQIAFPGKCDSSYLCSTFGLFEVPCEETDTFFDGVACVLEGEACCGPSMCSIPDCKTLPNLIQIPHRTTCTQFYLCFDETALVQNCPTEKGTFDIETNECVAQLGTCGDFCTETKTKREVQAHTYDNPICFNGSDLKCIKDGHFPVCSTCHSTYVNCANNKNVLSTCKEGEYFPPGIGFTDCVPLDECRKIEDRLFA